MPKLKLTKPVIDSIPLTEKGQQVYFDIQMTGFARVAGRTAKTYAAQRQMGPKTLRVTIGPLGIFSAEKARATAQLLLAAMAAGENPNLRRRERLAQGIAVAEAIDFAVEPLPPSEADRVPGSGVIPKVLIIDP